MARVAVLLGGLSPERPVSLSTGAGAVAALKRLGHEVVEIDPQNPGWIAELQDARVDVAFNVLHGAWGEDGRVQGVLEYLQIPYTHSGVLASALAMDKDKAKAIFGLAGIPVAAGKLMDRIEAAKSHPMALPYVVKPNSQGSSIGVFIVREGANRPPEQLLDPDWTYGDEVLVEEFIGGKELTVAVLGEKSGPRALGVTEIIPAGEWYDFNAKYAAGGSTHELPAKIPADIAEKLMRYAEQAHAVLGCRGLTRSDFKFDAARNRIILIEVNNQPGMTPTSLAPEQAAHQGMSYDALCQWILEDASCQR
jgi:D-alanine-D-alanine ligase